MFDELFQAVAKWGFGIPNLDKNDKVASKRVNAIARWLQQQPHMNARRVEIFYRWYAAKYPGYKPPRDLEKFIKFWETLRAESGDKS